MNRLMKIDSAYYREHYQDFGPVPTFAHPAWLDACCGANNWEVAAYTKGDEVHAMFPYLVRSKAGFKAIGNPDHTPYQSVLIKYPPDQKEATRLAFEKEVLNNIIEGLPKADQFNFRFHPNQNNLLALHWSGFELLTRYTYVLDGIQDHEALFAGYTDSTRRQIKKAEKALTVKPVDTLDTLFQAKIESESSTGEKVHGTLDEWNGIAKAILGQNMGTILEAVTEDGTSVGSILVVWDTESAYYLMGSTLIEYRNSGALSMLMNVAIKEASNHVDYFNFEGSMIPAVEKFFRGFGSSPIQYTEARKYNSKILKQRDKLLGRI